MKKIAIYLLPLLGLFSYCAAGVKATETYTNVYDYVAKNHLAALADVARADEVTKQAIEKTNKKMAEEKKWLELVPQSLGAFEKLSLAYQIVGSYVGVNNIDTDSNKWLPETVLRDLELLCGPADDLSTYLLSNLNYTQTSLGNVELQKMLVEPLTNIQQLTNRQAVVKYLVENKAVAAQLDTQLKIMQDSENDMISFWKSCDEATQKFIGYAYFDKFLWMDMSSLNTNDAALNASSFWRSVVIPGANATSPVTTLYFPVALTTFIAASLETDLSWSKNVWLAACSGLILLKELYWPFGRGYPVAFSCGIWGFTAISWLMMVPNLRNSLNDAQMLSAVCAMINQKMKNVAAYVTAAKEIGNIISSDAVLSRLLGGLAGELRFAESKSEDTKQLLNKLAAINATAGGDSVLSNRGRVLAAFKLMEKEKEVLREGLRAAGHIDALRSISKLYESREASSGAKYCFVEYKQAASPMLNLSEFWNPQLNPDIAVTNSVMLGEVYKAQNMMLTGPNKGGKSTALKALVLSVILAQTLGIAPARAMTLTPYTKIISYLNIADKSGKESLFQAEIRRARELINVITALPSNQFSFAIMDEMFTGTSAHDGEIGAYNFSQDLADCRNNLAVVATHFERLTELESVTGGKYKNYRVAVNELPDGSFSFPYKLEVGKSSQHIALRLLEQAGFARRK